MRRACRCDAAEPARAPQSTLVSVDISRLEEGAAGRQRQLDQRQCTERTTAAAAERARVADDALLPLHSSARASTRRRRLSRVTRSTPPLPNAIMSAVTAVAPVALGARLATRFRAPASTRRHHHRQRVATTSKAVAEQSDVLQKNKEEWNTLGSVCAVLGSQWGDEGKGKLVDILAQVRAPSRRVVGGIASLSRSLRASLSRFAIDSPIGRSRLDAATASGGGVARDRPRRRARVLSAFPGDDRSRVSRATRLRPAIATRARPRRKPRPKGSTVVIAAAARVSFFFAPLGPSLRSNPNPNPNPNSRPPRPRRPHPSSPATSTDDRSTTSSRDARAARTRATPSTTTTARSTRSISSPLASSTKSANASWATASSCTSPGCSRRSTRSRERAWPSTRAGSASPTARTCSSTFTRRRVLYTGPHTTALAW